MSRYLPLNGVGRVDEENSHYNFGGSPEFLITGVYHHLGRFNPSSTGSRALTVFE